VKTIWYGALHFQLAQRKIFEKGILQLLITIKKFKGGF
jgi:hypothetical protein